LAEEIIMLSPLPSFTIASFMCGHSTNIWELVAWRFVQGIGGGALLATSQAILVETFPPEELGLANALFGAGCGVRTNNWACIGWLHS
jgi:MFS family permease